MQKDEEYLNRILELIPDAYLHHEHRSRNLDVLYQEEIASNEELRRSFLRNVPDDEIVGEYNRRGLGPSSSRTRRKA